VTPRPKRGCRGFSAPTRSAPSSGHGSQAFFHHRTWPWGRGPGIGGPLAGYWRATGRALARDWSRHWHPLAPGRPARRPGMGIGTSGQPSSRAERVSHRAVGSSPSSLGPSMSRPPYVSGRSVGPASTNRPPDTARLWARGAASRGKPAGRPRRRRALPPLVFLAPEFFCLNASPSQIAVRWRRLEGSSQGTGTGATKSIGRISARRG
jgi:hypothetical protein